MKIIRSRLFDRYQELIFGMSTKDGGVSPPPFYMNLSVAVPDDKENVRKNRELFYNELGISHDLVNYQKQVHSNDIKHIISSGFAGDCDATCTNNKNVFLTVSVADCLPVFLYEPMKKVIAAVHAGWRGTEKKIVQKAVNELKEKFGADEKEMLAFIGPGICFKCFEVGDEVAENFRDKVKEKRGEKYYIDLKMENLMQLLECGLDKNNIEVSPLCTFEEKDLLHSYRRDGVNSGRMFGVIGMNRS